MRRTGTGEPPLGDRAAYARVIDDLIAAVPLLAALPEHTRRRLADAARVVRVPAGGFLFHEGDEADGLAIVLGGRLQVLQAGAGHDHHRVVGVLGRGSWVGELSLLTGAPRSAGVRAQRDAELLHLDRGVFEAVLDDEPELGMALARVVAHQLQQTRGVAVETARPNTLAVVPLGRELPTARFVDELRAALAPYGPVAELRLADTAAGADTVVGAGATDDHHHAWSEELDRLEEAVELVLLVADDPIADPAWAAFCARSADRTLVLLRGGTPPAWARPGGAVPLAHRDLVFVGASRHAARMASALDTLEPRAVHHVAEDGSFAAGTGRAARRASAHAWGLVLSGGGARGLAHLGVMGVLADREVAIDRVGGCSAGALAAVLLASGRTVADIDQLVRTELVERHPFTDFTVPRESLIRGRKAMAMLTRLFGDTRLEELALPCFVVSADLRSGQLVVHRRGLARDAVAASMAIPGFAPPVPLREREHTVNRERLLVDGGLLDNFPVDVMADMDEGPVIGVDVMRDLPVDGGDGSAPGIVTTLARAMVLGGRSRSERNRAQADVLISPDVADIALFDFDRIDDAIAAGRRAALAAVDELVG